MELPVIIRSSKHFLVDKCFSSVVQCHNHLLKKIPVYFLTPSLFFHFFSVILYGTACLQCFSQHCVGRDIKTHRKHSFFDVLLGVKSQTEECVDQTVSSCDETKPYSGCLFSPKNADALKSTSSAVVHFCLCIFYTLLVTDAPVKLEQR